MENLWALVTGASSGIGFAYAKELAINLGVMMRPEQPRPFLRLAKRKASSWIY